MPSCSKDLKGDGHPLSGFDLAVPLSSMPEIVWPSMLAPMAAQSIALQYQLDRTQWWPSQKILKWQLTQISQLVNFAFQNTPFYQHHYQQQRPRKVQTLDSFLQLPIVKRSDIQQFNDGIKSQAVPPSHGNQTGLTTSGSTGKPVEIFKTDLCLFMLNAFTLRGHHWQNRNPDALLATIRSYPEPQFQAPDGAEQQIWGPACKGIYSTGPAIALDSMTPVSEQLEWLDSNRPSYLMTYPSNLDALIEESEERSYKPDYLKQVVTLGELLPEHLRARAAESWNVSLDDTYSCQEAGTLALQCPIHEHYHVQSENVLLEVLNERDQPCQPGEVGRVVVTDLHNFASPLIRYELGDMAEVGEPCSCGRNLPVLKRIYGRSRNMLTYPDGSKAWPFMGGAGYYKKIAPIRQFQMLQTKPDTLEFHLVVTPHLTEKQKAALTKRLHETLRYAFKISYHHHDEITPGPGGKFEDFKSLL